MHRLGVAALCLAAAAMGGGPLAAAPASLPEGPIPVATRFQAGEPCLVCRKPLGDGDVAYVVHGRMAPVHAGSCEAAFLADPDGALASAQPRGALFHEDPSRAPSLRWGWFIFGTYLFLGLACGALCAHLACPRRRSVGRWYAAGLLLNVIAVAALLVGARPVRALPARLARAPATAEPLPCPECAHDNHPAARRCAGCGAPLTPAAPSEAARSIPRFRPPDA